MGEFNFDAYFKDNGLEFQGLDQSTGQPILKDASGKTGKFNTQAFLKDNGLPPNAKAVFNSPENALNEDAVGIVDRLKLTLGNEKGGVGYLKSRFEDASYSAKDGFVVKDKGVWKKADPSTGVIADPWEATKDIIEGAVSFVPETAAGVAAGTAGAVAGPAGSMAASSAAMGGVKAIKNALGMAFGTYTNDEGEFAKDVGWEMLMGFGGEATALGGKALFGKALSAIGDKAVGPVKELLAKSLGPIVGESPEAILRGMNRAKDVLPEAKGALARLEKGEISERAKDILKADQMDLMKESVAHADAAVTAVWNRNKASVMKEVGEDFSAPIGEVADKYVASLVDKGLGKFDFSKSPVADKFVKKMKALGIQDEAILLGEVNAAAMKDKVLAKELAGTFRTLTQEEIIESRMKNGMARNLAEQEAKVVQRIADVVHAERFGGTLKGAKGASQLLDIQKRINSELSSLFDGEATSATRLASELKNDLMQGIGQMFYKSGSKDGSISAAGKAFSTLNKEYSEVAGVLGRLKNAAGSDNPEVREATLRYFVPKIGNGVEMTNEMKLLKDVSPAFGAMANKIADKEAAKAFVGVTAKSMEGASLANAVRWGGGVAGTTAKVLGAGAAMPTTPQNLARTIEVMGKGNEWLAKLGKTDSYKLLTDPKAASAFVLSLASVQAQEGSLTRQLIGGIDATMQMRQEQQGQFNQMNQQKLQGNKPKPE